MEITSYTTGWNDMVDRCIELAKEVIPFGKFDYTENVISKKDIDKLIDKINKEMRQ